MILCAIPLANYNSSNNSNTLRKNLSCISNNLNCISNYLYHINNILNNPRNKVNDLRINKLGLSYSVQLAFGFFLSWNKPIYHIPWGDVK